MQVSGRIAGMVWSALSVCCLTSASACSSDAGGSGSRVGGPRDTKSTLAGAAGMGFDPLLKHGNDTKLTTNTAPSGMQKLPEGVCAQATVTANREIPTVWLVIDGSTSMNTPFGLGAGAQGPGAGPGMPPAGPGPAAAAGGGTRWTVLREALVGANGVVTKLESVVKFGMTIYGNRDPAMCPSLVEVKPPALNNLMTMSGMYPMVETGGGTPTGEALQTVVDALPDFSNPTLDGRGEKAPIIILATDGEPNGCSEAVAKAVDCLAGADLDVCLGDLLNQVASAAATYETTLKAVQTAKDKQIPVWVISLAAGLNNIPDLQRTANIGAGLDENASPGATIYSPQNPDDLTNTLAQLIGDQVECTVELNGTLDVKRACEGTVNINGLPLMCNADPGWMPVDPKHIALQGMACQTFKSDPSVFLDARFPCDVVVPD